MERVGARWVAEPGDAGTGLQGVDGADGGKGGEGFERGFADASAAAARVGRGKWESVRFRTGRKVGIEEIFWSLLNQGISILAFQGLGMPNTATA